MMPSRTSGKVKYGPLSSQTIQMCMHGDDLVSSNLLRWGLPTTENASSGLYVWAISAILVDAAFQFG